MFFIVDTFMRNRFEKQYQVPYGYSDSPSFITLEKAIECIERMPDRIKTLQIVEKCENGACEVVYTIKIIK